MDVFQFDVPKRKKSVIFPETSPRITAEDEDEFIGLIQGHAPDSVQEWRVAKALWRYKVAFEYQVPFFGGWYPQGQIVDFVVYIPMPTALMVHGTYWHSGERASDEIVKIRKLGMELPVIEVYEDELETQYDADEWVRDNLL